MTFKAITIEDQPIFLAAQKALAPTTSDTVFTNLFIWRSYYKPQWTEDHGCICVICHPPKGEPFGLTPIGGGDRLSAIDFLFDQLIKLGVPKPSIKQVPEALAKLITESRPTYTCQHDRDNDDYVYTSQQLITLSGRKMHQKKNHYNYFVGHNQFECLHITTSMIPELLEVHADWLATKEDLALAEHLQYEMESVHELIRHMELLNQLGLAIKINGKIEAFTLGEIMSPDTAVVHVEKANYEYRGLFIALASHFCREFFQDIPYINREQDLGLPGLRQSKESLKPDHMRIKFIVWPT